MATAQSLPPDLGENGKSSGGDIDRSLDAALRQAVETLDSPQYQEGNLSFHALTARDWAVIGAAYVAVPVLLAVAVWVS